MKKASGLRETPFYQRFPARQMVGKVDRHVCISDDPAFIYFRISKAANTNVTATLFYARHGHLNVGIDDINAYKLSFRRPSDLSEAEVDGLLDTHPSFAVVRNPYARFLSAYLGKIANKTREKEKVAAWLGRELDQPILIEEFLDYLEQGGILRDPHWCRQTDMILIGVGRLRHLVRTESVERDLPPVLAEIFGRPIPFQNFNKRVRHASRRAPDLLSDELLARLHRLYRVDFRELGYPKKLT
jgi:hypothetical protein